MRVKGSFFLFLLVMMFFLVTVQVVGEEKASDFTLVDISGNSFTLSTCPAEVILIDFFGTYCGPCKDENPTLRSLYNEHSRDELEIISISPEDEGTLQTFAHEYNMEWIVASDPTGEVSNAYGVAYIPRTFLVDAKGYIRYDHTGWGGDADALELRSKIDSLLSGTGNGGNGDSDGDSGTGQSGPPYTLIAIIGGVVILLVIVGIVVAGQLLGWSESPRKRRSRKRR